MLCTTVESFLKFELSTRMMRHSYMAIVFESRGSFYNLVGGCVIPSVLNLKLTRV